MAKEKYKDLFKQSEAKPDNLVEKKSQNKKPKKERTNHKGTRAPGGKNFKLPQVQNQPFDPVALQKGIAENQQEILQTPAAKQRNKDAQDPFKNGFFNSKEELYRKNEKSQNADRVIQQNGAAERRNAVDVAKGEQTNAQKLFAPAVPDIQTDKQGNKLASRNGVPVGYSGNPKGAGSPVDPRLTGKNRGNPNGELGMTDVERKGNREIIQNVASQFEPTDIVGREMYRRQQTGEGNKFSLPQTPPQPTPPQQPTPPTQSSAPAQQPAPSTSNSGFGGFNIPQVSFDPLGLMQTPKSTGVEHLPGTPPAPPAPTPVTTPDDWMRAVGLAPQVPPTPPYVDDFSNVTPIAQAQPTQQTDPNFWQQFAGVPAIDTNRSLAKAAFGSSPTNPMEQRFLTPEQKMAMQADQAQLLQGLPFNRRAPKPDQFVNQF